MNAARNSSSRFAFYKIIFLFLVLSAIGAPAFGQVSAENIPLPEAALDRDEIRFAALGDSGTGGGEQYEIAERLLQIQRQTNFDLLLFLGDNIYENGSPRDIEKKFLKPYHPLYERGVELRGAIGNHDARDPFGVMLQQLIFKMGTKTFYSFTKKENLVEFFAIDSTLLAKKQNSAGASEQLTWFEKQLDSSKALWKVAFLHHPLYSSAKKHGFESSDADELENVRRALEPFYLKYEVRISLNGHDHVYERTKPQKGVQYFTSGAGAKLRPGDLERNSPFFASGNDETRSFMLFSVKPDRIVFWSIGADGKILDSGVIDRKASV